MGQIINDRDLVHGQEVFREGLELDRLLVGFSSCHRISWALESDRSTSSTIALNHSAMDISCSSVIVLIFSYWSLLNDKLIPFV